ncbi:MAG TPA: S8 family serine peptidase, partial [Luteolibacter sp.]
DDFGRYNNYARDSDSLAFNAPYYLIFRSAGNDRTDNPALGQKVALTPGGGTVVNYDPALHPAGDGNYRGGFETIGFDAIAKNVITIGSSADAETGGLRDPSKANSSSFSAWGPTDDGRIKPDVVANGDALYSSLSGSNTSYGTYSGTSMATPNATGSASLLVQQYGNLFPGQAMRSSTLKGLLIHTADDRGNAGPDYKYGWGLINVKAAADLISDHHSIPAKQRIAENQLTSATTFRTHAFVWDGVSPIRTTLSWTDPAATALSTADSRSPRLVNNLNLKIIAPNGSEFFPFVMPFVGTWTPATMNSTATTGINNTDNVEQALVAAPPAAGTYQAVVSFSGTLANNSQNYSLLISGSSGDPPPPPPLALASVSPNSGLPGNVTIDLTGTGLRADTAVKLARSGQSDIIATGGQLIGETFRCQVNLAGAAAGLWDVVATNPNLETSTLAAAFNVVGAIWSENFDGPVTGWTSEVTSGSNSWSLVTTNSQSPAKSYFAPGPVSKSTTNLTSPSIPIPAGATNLQLKFWQNRNLQ